MPGDDSSDDPREAGEPGLRQRLGRAARLGAVAARTGAGLLTGSLLSALGGERSGASSPPRPAHWEA